MLAWFECNYHELFKFINIQIDINSINLFKSNFNNSYLENKVAIRNKRQVRETETRKPVTSITTCIQNTIISLRTNH